MAHRRIQFGDICRIDQLRERRPGPGIEQDLYNGSAHADLAPQVAPVLHEDDGSLRVDLQLVGESQHFFADFIERGLHKRGIEGLFRLGDPIARRVRLKRG